MEHPRSVADMHKSKFPNLKARNYHGSENPSPKIGSQKCNSFECRCCTFLGSKSEKRNIYVGVNPPPIPF